MSDDGDAGTTSTDADLVPDAHGADPDPTAVESRTPAPLVEGAALHPHEPGGFRSIVDINFGATQIPTGVFARSGDVSRGIVRGQIKEQAAPAGAVVVLGGGNYGYRSLKQTGAAAGSSGNGTFIAKEDLPGNTDGNTVHSYSEWYEHIVMRMYGEGGTNDFEYCSITGRGKFGGLRGVATPGNVVPGAIVLIMRRGSPIGGYPGGITPPAGPGDYTTRMFLDLEQQGTVSQVGTTRGGSGVNRNSPQNMGAPIFYPGLAWQTVEYYFRVNTIGVDDGIFRAWVNGVLVTEYLDIRYRDAANPRGLTAVNWAQVYGGGTPSDLKTRNDYQELDRMYVSVGAMVD